MLALFLSVAAVGAGCPTGGGQKRYCGNGACDPEETPASCLEDCGFCGDGILDPERNEECDATDFGGQTCSSICGHLIGGSLMCTTDCMISLWGCNSCEPVCGDGITEGNEECDDGNNDAGDGCSPDCQVE